MDKQFKFTLEKQEYLNLLRYQSLHSKQGRGMKLWLTTCIPALLICTVIFLKLYTQILWVCLAIVLAVIWVMYGSLKIWKKYIYRRINDDTLKQLNITGFQEVTVTFHESKIMYKDNKIHEIPYKDVYTMIPADDMFIFQYKNQGTLLLPYRLFKSPEDVSSFFKEFEKTWRVYK